MTLLKNILRPLNPTRVVSMKISLLASMKKVEVPIKSMKKITTIVLKTVRNIKNQIMIKNITGVPLKKKSKQKRIQAMIIKSIKRRVINRKRKKMLKSMKKMININ